MPLFPLFQALFVPSFRLFLRPKANDWCASGGLSPFPDFFFHFLLRRFLSLLSCQFPRAVFKYKLLPSKMGWLAFSPPGFGCGANGPKTGTRMASARGHAGFFCHIHSHSRSSVGGAVAPLAVIVPRRSFPLSIPFVPTSHSPTTFPFPFHLHSIFQFVPVSSLSRGNLPLHSRLP